MMLCIRPAISFRIFLFLTGAMSASAQLEQYEISTYAGGAQPPAPMAEWDVSITTDSAGNTYFTSQNSLFKIDLKGAVTRIAGNSRPGYSGDGGPAASAQLYTPIGLAVHTAGTDSDNHRVRRISSDGIIVTIAGNGMRGLSSDGGPATSAKLSCPSGLAVEGSSNLFVVDAVFLGFQDSGIRLRRISPDGIINTVAGGGLCCSYSPDGGPAVGADLTGLNRIAVDGLLMASGPTLAQAPAVNVQFARLPLHFEPYPGGFLAHAAGGTLELAADSVHGPVGYGSRALSTMRGWKAPNF